ncbi:hypothetical protein ON010_g10975 [Phytophthora cinnamomi]|nr:hypothetical protein ON010_g10975 [Phytophthora cinnamomi]
MPTSRNGVKCAQLTTTTIQYAIKFGTSAPRLLHRSDILDDILIVTKDGRYGENLDDSTPFTFGYKVNDEGDPLLGDGTDEDPFVLALSTKDMLRQLDQDAHTFLFHMDATFKVNSVEFSLFSCGDPRSPGLRFEFGLDFGTAGDEWTTEFCQKDSDGDGQTNGQELGDPCCVWTVGGTPQWTSGVSHPGDSSSTSDESLWADITCSGDSNSTSTSTSSTAGSNASTVEAGSTTTTETTDAATPASASSSSAAASSGSSAASVVTPAMCSAVSVAAAVAAFFM